MSPEGEILGEWFGRTLIRSCVKLAYEHAQAHTHTSPRTIFVQQKSNQIKYRLLSLIISPGMLYNKDMGNTE